MLDLALWAVWALNIRNGYSLLLQYFVGTIAVVLITRLATIVVLSLIDRGFSISPDILQRFPGLETRANRYLPLLRKIVSASSPSSASWRCSKSGASMPSSGSMAARSAAGCCRR